MANKSKNTRIKAVRSFWRWFTANAERLKVLHASRDFAEIAREVNQELDKIEPQLAWELGPGKKQPNLFTISSEGNPELRPLAEMMIELAPKLSGWEFYFSRPPRQAPAVVRLLESGQAFDTSGWDFVPLERAEEGRLDLIIADDHLAHSDRGSALKAVSICLDELLGEDTVETWIGEFRVESLNAVQGKRAHKLADLPDYLLWATHRKDNPLRKRDHRAR